MRIPTAVLLAVALAACGGGGEGGGGGHGGGGGGGGAPGVPLVLAAGPVGVDAEAPADWVGDVDLDRIGVDSVDAVFDLTTPKDEPFEFDVLTRAEGNTGAVRVSIAHAADDGFAPAGGPTTLAEAGVIPSGTGTTSRDEWLDAHGDGFARVTIRGQIDRDQVVAVQTDNGDSEETALVRVRIGAESEINVASDTEGDYPGVLDRKTLYSSDSWQFGLPTIAVSGDRTSVVFYEGDRADPRGNARFEMRLQHEAATDTVTGGGSEETSEDTGHWRDHEIAALYNVLALVHSGTRDVTVMLSFDRGATFAQTERFGTGADRYSARLAQIAMALDYSTAVVFWRTGRDGVSELVLVEGRPSELDGTGSPTRFEFDDPVVVFRARGDVSPLLMSAAWSEGGDLVIGYAYTSFTSGPDRTWVTLTQNRCAVRLYGGDLADVLVDEDRVVGRDPSVALLGTGTSMRIFYAYEGVDGVRLAVSEDGGRSFSPPYRVRERSAHTPSVFARQKGDETRLDLLYLAAAGNGQELHLLHWDDYGATTPGQFRLTEAKMVRSRDVPRDDPVPGAEPGAFVPDEGFRITQVAWFGYDAVLDGDDLRVVYDEQTFDAWVFCVGPPFLDRGMPVPAGAYDGSEGFIPADPPPLAPGMTEPVPAPDPAHMHQLELLRLD